MRYNTDEMEKLQNEQDMARRAEQMAQIKAQINTQQYGGAIDLGQSPGWSPLSGQLGKAGISGQILQQQAQGPKRNPELPTAVTELNQLAVTLMNVLMDLEKRLEPVTRSVPPATQANGNVDQGSRTQLGSMVYQATHTIDLAVSRVRDLLDRLEV